MFNATLLRCYVGTFYEVDDVWVALIRYLRTHEYIRFAIIGQKRWLIHAPA